MEPRKSNAELLFINYHYIRDPGQYHYPGIHPISLKNFEVQVDWLSEHFHMATPAEAEAFIYGHNGLPKNSVVLTFDDGLLDQYQAAQAILNTRGIKGIFFITSQPLMDMHANTLQKTHWLRANTEPSAFEGQLLNLLSDDWKKKLTEPKTITAAEKIYIYDSPSVGRIKYLINFLLPESLMDEISSKMLDDRGIDEGNFCSEVYMSKENIKELHLGGHLIGAHGHKHIPFTRIPDNDNKEIEMNTHFLSTLTGVKPNWVSYPFGRGWAIPGNPEAFCKAHGFKIGLTLTQGWNCGSESPFLIKRVNTNEVEQTVSSYL